MLRSTYTRVAVVQLGYHPAAIIQRRSPLEDPLFALGTPDSLPDGGRCRPICTMRAAQLRGRVRVGLCA